eukprot:GHVR01079516.1.p1 GENE.GHVR01079516.1~~GHVR01079516.1.p1  ORF type:complete len:127 (-),score=5.43 GHVR01079516.1:262-642(-)
MHSSVIILFRNKNFKKKEKLSQHSQSHLKMNLLQPLIERVAYSCDKDGTALCLDASITQSHRYDVVELLLDAGALPNVQTSYVGICTSNDLFFVLFALQTCVLHLFNFFVLFMILVIFFGLCILNK